MDKDFSIDDALGYGWDCMKNNLKFFIPAVLLMWVAAGIPSGLQSASSFLNWKVAIVFGTVFGLVSFVVGIFISIAGVKIGLGFVDGRPGDLSDLYNGYPLFWKMLGTWILYMLLVLAGLILLIVPGIYWAVRYRFSMYAVVDEGLGPVEAMKRSGQLTRGVWWHLAFFYLAMVGINMLGSCLCLVGLLFAVPVVIVAEAYVFRSLKGQLAVGTKPVPPQPAA